MFQKVPGRKNSKYHRGCLSGLESPSVESILKERAELLGFSHRGVLLLLLIYTSSKPYPKRESTSFPKQGAKETRATPWDIAKLWTGVCTCLHLVDTVNTLLTQSTIQQEQGSSSLSQGTEASKEPGCGLVYHEEKGK